MTELSSRNSNNNNNNNNNLILINLRVNITIQGPITKLTRVTRKNSKSPTIKIQNNNKKLRDLSSRANYTDPATAACRQSHCQLSRIEDATWSARRILTAVFSDF
jgi:hypothetical protein